jgi:tRNA(fMet)-specific endonuclease VapC
LSRYCLDTSAYSHFKRGDANVVDAIDAADWIGVPAVVLGELRTGFLLGNRLADNEAELREFLANPVVEQLPVDRDVARI